MSTYNLSLPDDKNIKFRYFRNAKDHAELRCGRLTWYLNENTWYGVDFNHELLAEIEINE